MGREGEGGEGGKGGKKGSAECKQIFPAVRSRDGRLTWVEPQLHRDLHCHAVQELLHCLAVDGDGHSGVCIEGELQAVEHPGLVTILSGAVSIVFVPDQGRQKSVGQGSRPARAL